MPEFPISSRAREYTRAFVANVFGRIGQVSSVGDAFNMNESLNAIAADYHITWLGDVVDHVWRFGILRAASLETTREMPFVQLGDAGDVPILQNVMSGFPPFPSFPPFWSVPLGFIEEWLALSRLKLIRVGPEFALNIFAKLLSPFLENRFESGIRAEGGAGNVPPAGGSGPSTLPNGNYLVRLTSRQHGWHAFKSPAYGMDFTDFGAPTYPVWGYLSGGRWIFAGTLQASSQLVTDPTVFVIPDTLTPQVNAF